METTQKQTDSYVCQECDAKHIAYKFRLHSWLIDILRKIAERPQPACLKELDLSKSQWTNAQKLNYWGFVRPVKINEQRRHGYWQLTERGRQFLNGEIEVNQIAVMRDNKLLRYEGSFVSATLADHSVETRSDYQRQIKEQL